jgi:hypothetical protein
MPERPAPGVFDPGIRAQKRDVLRLLLTKRKTYRALLLRYDNLCLKIRL